MELALSLWLLFAPGQCHPEPVTVNTPTGIAGCERWGRGIASHYGPGNGVAMNFCTWTLRHRLGCGSVAVRAIQTGVTVTAPVVDFCDCYTGTGRERIIDLQWGVVEALGLPLSQGLYPVEVQPAGGLPDTAMKSSPQGGAVLTEVTAVRFRYER